MHVWKKEKKILWLEQGKMAEDKVIVRGPDPSQYGKK